MTYITVSFSSPNVPMETLTNKIEKLMVGCHNIQTQLVFDNSKPWEEKFRLEAKLLTARQIQKQLAAQGVTASIETIRTIRKRIAKRQN